MYRHAVFRRSGESGSRNVLVEYLALEVEEAESLELHGGLGAEVGRQGPWQALQLLNAVGDPGLEPVQYTTKEKPIMQPCRPWQGIPLCV